jgi:1,4-dihydroxy-2-naphthoyl-CoA hydrolase
MNWRTTNLDQINSICKNTLMEYIGIVFTELSENSICATMPVNNKNKQPMGQLHGGASIVLLESLASVGSDLLCNPEIETPVGLEVNANHVGAIDSGFVKGEATLIHHGKQTHVWLVNIFNLDNNKLICSGRITIMILKKNKI